MILLAILTGVLLMVGYNRLVSPVMLVTLPAWGLLAAGTPIGEKLLPLLNGISSTLDGWLR